MREPNTDGIIKEMKEDPLYVEYINQKASTPWKYRTEIRNGKKYLVIEVEGEDFKHVLVLDERRFQLINQVWARRPDPKDERATP